MSFNKLITVLLLLLLFSPSLSGKEITPNRDLINRAIENLKVLKSYKTTAEIFITVNNKQERDTLMVCEMNSLLKKRHERTLGILEPSKTLWDYDFYVIGDTYYSYSKVKDIAPPLVSSPSTGDLSAIAQATAEGVGEGDKKDDKTSGWESGRYTGKDNCLVDGIIDIITNGVEKFKRTNMIFPKDFSVGSAESYSFTPSAFYYYQDVEFIPKEISSYVFIDRVHKSIKGCYVKAKGKINKYPADYLLKISYKYNPMTNIDVPDLSKPPLDISNQ